MDNALSKSNEDIVMQISAELSRVRVTAAQFARLLGENNPKRWTRPMLESGLRVLKTYK